MPKSSAYQPSFNAGELSPRMEGRVDFERYQSGVSRALNLVALPQGGHTRVPGTRFIIEVKDSTQEGTGLIPFDPTADTAYILEGGASYFRFYRDQAQLYVPATDAVIANGTFDTIASGGWTDESTGSATVTWVTDAALLSGSANGTAWIQQEVAVGTAYIDVLHTVLVHLDGSPGSKATIQVGSATLTSDLFKATGRGLGWHLISFTPGATSFFFQVLSETAGEIELDDVRILSDEALELPHTYTAAQINATSRPQSADVMYFFHPDMKTHKLERLGDASWSFVEVFFTDGPWGALNPGTDLHDTQLVKDPAFESGYANWDDSSPYGGDGFASWLFGDGSPLAGTGPGQAAGAIFGILFHQTDGTAAAAGARQQITTENPTALHIMHFQVLGSGRIKYAIGTTSTGVDIVAETTVTPGWYTISFTPGASTFWIRFYHGDKTETSAVPGLGGAFIYNTSANLLKASAVSGEVTITAQGDFSPFTVDDIGRSIRIEFPGREPGWGVITGYTSAKVVTVWVVREFASTAPTEAWRLGSWSDVTGWPAAGAFHQQRLVAGRTVERPQTIWASQSSDFENMQPDSFVEGGQTVEDDDALDLTLASKKVAAVNWFSSTSKGLMVGTSNGIWVLSSQGPAITPTDRQAQAQPSVPSAALQPIEIEEVAVYIHRTQQRLYDVGFRIEVDGYRAADLNLLADHITRNNPIQQIVYQEEPLSLVWARLADGTLASLTYKREQNVVGWSEVDMASVFYGAASVESIAVIPGDDGGGRVYDSGNRDELWLLVHRYIGGVEQRYIEVMEGFFEGPARSRYDTRTEWREAVKDAQVDAVYLDCALTYQGASTDIVSGLDHLEGETVTPVVDGAVQATKVVTAGNITLDLAGTTIHVGLNKSWRWRSLKWPFGAATGSGIGKQKTPIVVNFVLQDACSFNVGVERQEVDASMAPASFRLPSDPMGEAIPLFSGEWGYNPGGNFDKDPRVVLTGDIPLPWTLLGIGPDMKTNELQ